MSSTPFNYFKSKNNKNAFYACYNGGPKIKCYINNTKSYNYDKPKIRYKSEFKINKRPCGCLISNNNNNIIKLKKNFENINDGNYNIYDYINNNRYRINTDINSNNIKNEEIKSDNNDNKDNKDINIFNYFKKKPVRRFNKIQIHNICKPFLVDDYRYYAEKYLKI